MEKTGAVSSSCDLVERCLGGDREAFGEIVRKYQSLVSGFTFGMTGDFHKSEDLAQETFLIAWTKLAELRDIAKLPHWLCGIARNLVRNERTRAVGKPGTTGIDDADTLGMIADGNSSPIDEAIREERNQMVGRALSRIPEKYRVPLIMSIRSEKSVAEIAMALELTEEALYQRISRAKKHLRRELEKQVEGAVRDSGPGELFSLAVIAALPAAANIELPAKVAVSSAVFAVGSGNTSCTTGGCSGSSCVVSYSLGGFVKALVASFAFVLSWFLMTIGATPAVWYAVRNAPTLRARRALILASLRAHFLFGLFCLLFFFFRELGNIAIYMIPYQYLKPFFPHTNDFNGAYHGGLIAVSCFISWIFVLVLFLCWFSYRKILKIETGLLAPKNSVPLEESKLSLRRMKRSLIMSGVVLLILFVLTVALFPLGFQVDFARGYTLTVCGMQSWQVLLWNSKIVFVIVGPLFLFVFWEVHRKFISMATDEQAFLSSPPIVDEKTPLGSRILMEWTLGFGLYFIMAGMIILTTRFSLMDMLTRSPFLFFWLVVLLILTSLGATLIHFRWPILRPLTTVAILIGFVVAAYYSIDFSLMLAWAKSGLYPFRDFFDTLQSWPVVFAVMILSAVIVYVVIVSLVLGVILVRSKSVAKAVFPSRKKILLIFGIGVALILLASPMVHMKVQRNYVWAQLIGRRNADPGEAHAKKMLVFLDAFVQKFAHEDSPFVPIFEGQRGLLHLRTGEYDQAIDEFTSAIEHLEMLGHQRNYDYFYRGVAKLAKGDYHGAIMDFDQVSGDYKNNMDIFYHRGVAHEKLGDYEAAIRDYTIVIENREQFQDPPPVRSMFQRPIPESGTVLTCDISGFIGYEIRLEQMKQIRDSLQTRLLSESEPRQ